MFEILRWVTILVAAASLSTMLAKSGAADAGEIAHGVLVYYERLLSDFFGLLQLPVDQIIDVFRLITGQELQLYNHWKHVFVLLWMLQGSAIIASIRLKALFIKQTIIDVQGYSMIDAAIGFIVGLPLTLTVSIAAGTVPISSGNGFDIVAFGALILIGMQLTYFIVYLVSYGIGAISSAFGFRLRIHASDPEDDTIIDEDNRLAIENFFRNSRPAAVAARHLAAAAILMTIYCVISYYLLDQLTVNNHPFVGIYSMTVMVFLLVIFLAFHGFREAYQFTDAGVPLQKGIFMSSSLARARDIVITIMMGISAQF